MSTHRHSPVQVAASGVPPPSSDDDEYESYYVPVMAACAGVGHVLFDNWVEWVLRGHHGHKEENIRPFKWRGLGKYAGHTKLYSLAKKQRS